MVAGVKPSVDDWNAGFLPQITVTGLVGTSDLAADAVTFASLNPNFILGGTLVTKIAGDDMLLIGQASSADNRVIKWERVLGTAATAVTDATAFADVTKDVGVFWNRTAETARAMTVSRWAEKLIEQSSETTVVAVDDEIGVRDVSFAEGARYRKVKVANILPDIVTAATVDMPTRIAIDAKGRVTAVSSTTGSDQNTSGELALPTAAGAATSVPWAHGLAVRPLEVSVMLVCKVTNANYAVNAVIDHRAVRFDWDTGEDRGSGYVIEVDATNVRLIQPSQVNGMYLPDRTSGTPVTFTPASWRAIIRARK
jgi:hypothetical protein